MDDEEEQQNEMKHRGCIERISILINQNVSTTTSKHLNKIDKESERERSFFFVADVGSNNNKWIE
jgi:hypothetical protein